MATLGCFAVAIAAGFAFVAVERRVAVPLLDLALLRNRVLVGSTIAILIGAGTINGLMYLLSLYFQDPAALGLQPARGGPGHAAGDGRAGASWPHWCRGWPSVRRSAVDRRGFAITAVGFACVGSRRRLVGVRRLRAAAGRHRRRHGAVATGPRRRRRRRACRADQVGEASGVSNMARYVGAAVAPPWPPRSTAP